MQHPDDPFPVGLASVQRRLECGPQIGAAAFVAPNATVVGDVLLEAESSVWFGAVLRGDLNRIVIGPRSNIQDGAIVHLADNLPALIGEMVTVGHGAIVHACTVGDEVLIGMGTIILDGAQIGPRSIIGANALVTGGTKIPEGSLVLGSPAKVIRSLTSDEQATTRVWADKYVENARIFRAYYADRPVITNPVARD